MTWAKRSSAQRAAWRNPATRAKRIAAQRAAYARPESRIRKSVVAKALWLHRRPEMLGSRRSGNVPPGYDELLCASHAVESARLRYVRHIWQRYRLDVETFARLFN